MSGDDQETPDPSWELGDYVIRPRKAAAEPAATVPWRRIALLALLGVVVAAVAFVVVIAA